MTILDYLHPHSPANAEQQIPVEESEVAAPANVEDVKTVEAVEEKTTSTSAPEDIAASTTVEPLNDDVSIISSLSYYV